MTAHVRLPARAAAAAAVVVAALLTGCTPGTTTGGAATPSSSPALPAPGTATVDVQAPATVAPNEVILVRGSTDAAYAGQWLSVVKHGDGPDRVLAVSSRIGADGTAVSQVRLLRDSTLRLVVTDLSLPVGPIPLGTEIWARSADADVNVIET